uniref:Uncharacterized protein n=1 Tax=viral metagenome TaxID=1070528 RepID=A0A6C0H741_9ZZZZ
MAIIREIIQISKNYFSLPRKYYRFINKVSIYYLLKNIK